MSIFILFKQEATTQDAGRRKIPGALTERGKMEKKHFSKLFNNIIQIGFIILFYFSEMNGLSLGCACQQKFISCHVL